MRGRPSIRGAAPDGERIPPIVAGLRSDLLTIYRAALRAAQPGPILAQDIEGDPDAGWKFRGSPLLPPRAHAGDPVFLFGAGKAASALGYGVARRLAGETVSGRIIVKRGHGTAIPGVAVEEAGHPVPDADSVASTHRLLDELRDVGEGGRILFLLTGGASALLVSPAPGITLEQKSKVSSLLLASGADIHEMNAVRKHLSAVKGGQLLPFFPPGRSSALVISDVVGDDLTSIGSGPAAADPTTFEDALQVLHRFDLIARVPGPVIRRLQDGAAGRLAETPACPETVVPHFIVASNARSLAAAVRAAERLGYRSEIFGRDLVGEVHDAARRFAERLAELAAADGRFALLAGGELTLRVVGDGRGGRSQELALVAGGALEGVPQLALLAAGTDGTDGPTDAAGAFADGKSWRRARMRGLDPAAHLRRNDAWTVHRETGDLLVTGPTGTNVMDLIVGLTGGGETSTGPGTMPSGT